MTQKNEEPNQLAALQSKEAALKKALEQRRIQDEFDKRTTPKTTKNNFNVEIVPSGVDITFRIFEETNISKVLPIFKALYGNRPDYKEPIKNSDGSYTFRFPAKKGNGETMPSAERSEEMTSFFIEADIKEKRHLMLDSSHKNVLGYSDGDGNKYRFDGKPFEPADWGLPGIPLDRFDMSLMDGDGPAPAPALGMR